MRFLEKGSKNNFSKFQSIFEKEELAFQWIGRLKERFPKAEIYLVGGAVRDIILGHSTKDFDFVIRNVSADELEKFLETLGTVNLVGRLFGVFKFKPKDWDPHNPLDIALPRKEHVFGTGGYRDLKAYTDPKMPIKDDLSRRDFTINAMALKVEIKNFKFEITKIVDPFGGIKDLRSKIIRTVGRPEARFREDYSRMLRALRFACQLDFLIEKKTWLAIKQNIRHLNDIQREVKMVGEVTFAEPEVIENRIVPYEVIAKEFLKSFYFDSLKAFDLYDQSGAFEVLIPEVLKMKNCPQPKNWHSEGDVWTHTRLALEKLFSPEFQGEFGQERPSIELIMAVLFHDLGKPYTIQTPEKDGTDRIRFNEHDIIGAKLTKQIAERLKFSSPEEFAVDPDRLAWLVQHHMLLVQGNISEMRPTTIEKYFFNPNLPGENLLKLAFVDISATITEKGKPDFKSYQEMKKRILELKLLSQNKKELPKPLLNGNEIMKEFNLQPGPKIGELLVGLREEQLLGRIKTKDEAIEFLKKYLTKNKVDLR
jgi:tRNA nucleotidyltransferase/poly(A) polymerase